jgi:hypothetical protein
MYANIRNMLDGAGFEFVGGGEVRAVTPADVAAAQAVLPTLRRADVPRAIHRHEEDLIRVAMIGSAIRVSDTTTPVVVGVPQVTVCGRCVARLLSRELRPLPVGFTPGSHPRERTEHAIVSPIPPDVEARMMVMGRDLARALAGLPRG